MSLTLGADDLPRPQELARNVLDMLEINGDGAAVWVGHSFGSAAMAYVLKHAPVAVAACVFVEPVTFLLNLPDVSGGFLFRRDADPVLDLLQKDPAISFSLRKRFWWQESILFAEDVGTVPCDVFLAEEDKIVPSAAVDAYLRKRGGPLVDVRTFEARGHGSWQYDDATTSEVVDAALARCRAVDEASGRRSGAGRA